MSIIDLTSKPLPEGYSEVLDNAMQNIRACQKYKTTADLPKIKEGLENAVLALTVVTRDLNFLSCQSNVKVIK
jgi:hypothetical protein